MLRYLLGDLPEEEQFALEQEYFNDNEKFEQVWALENELVDSYVRGRLPQAERVLFEQNYLASPKHRERVSVARSLLQSADETIVADRTSTLVSSTTPWWTNVLAFFQVPQLIWSGAAAMALLFLIVAGWWYTRNGSDPTEQIAQQSPPVSLHTPSVAPTSPQPIATTTPTATLPSLPPSTRPVMPTVLAFTLGGALRDKGKIQPLPLPPGTKQVRLRLTLDANEYPRYQVTLRTVSGSEVFAQSSLQPTGKSIVVTIPADKLANGDYSLQLLGNSPSGDAEDITTYLLRVTRK
ncbi:MAG TPA: hypothetical protein VFZ34_17645 [Blastocatellia bacterium]|nr:hypothetical protein [Blastocatellia bacterium]